MKKEAGNVADILAAGICVLAMTVVMMAYMDCAGLIRQKTRVSQLARKYILQMETTGGLTAQDRTALCQELKQAGASGIDLTGTTMDTVPYSSPIFLEIKGILKEKYEFRDRRVSTSKS